MSHEDSSVLITGGNGGLGGTVVSRFAAAGWRVVVPVRSLSKVDKDGDKAAEVKYVEADLFEPESVRGVADLAASQEDRPLRAVVNLVGGFAAGGRVHETPIEDFEKQFRLNLRATYLVTQATVGHLIAAGRGSITCVSSRSALRPFAGAAGYISSKLAVLGLVDALSTEYLGDGVRVNAVLPSVIDTPANRAGQPDADVSAWVTVDQVADVLLFLSSDAASAISGARVPVYGRA